MLKVVSLEKDHSIVFCFRWNHFVAFISSCYRTGFPAATWLGLVGGCGAQAACRLFCFCLCSSLWPLHVLHCSSLCHLPLVTGLKGCNPVTTPVQAKHINSWLPEAVCFQFVMKHKFFCSYLYLITLKKNKTKKTTIGCWNRWAQSKIHY